jgi:hypothetical protein
LGGDFFGLFFNASPVAMAMRGAGGAFFSAEGV